MRTLWKILAWAFLLCGMITEIIGFLAMLSGITLWGIPSYYWVLHAIAWGVFGLFFLIYHAYDKSNERR